MTLCVARRHGEPNVGCSVARESRSVGLAGAKTRSEVKSYKGMNRHLLVPGHVETEVSWEGEGSKSSVSWQSPKNTVHVHGFDRAPDGTHRQRVRGRPRGIYI
jgi:hypothetical protein